MGEIELFWTGLIEVKEHAHKCDRHYRLARAFLKLLIRVDKETNMLTYVTAFYPTRTDVDVDSYWSEFQFLAETGVPLLVFLDPDGPEITVPPSVRVIRRRLPAAPSDVILPGARNIKKDTADFLWLILQKLYVLSEALQYTEAEHLAWIDFRIFHVIRHKQLAQTKLKAVASRTFPGLTKLLSPGCWEGSVGASLFDAIQWRFCGGLVLGPRAAIEPAYRRQMELVEAHLPRITWEVNYWAMMEDHFEWYKADHNDSIVMNLPYSPRIVRPGATTYYVDGGQYRRVHVGQAIEQSLFSALCDVSEDGVLLIPKTDMLVESSEYRRMKQSVPWDDPAIADEGSVPRGTVLALDTSRGISQTGVIHYPLDDVTFRDGLRVLSGPRWSDRKPLAIWRGGTSGVERPTVRLRVVESLRDCPYADAKFVRGGWPMNDASVPEEDYGSRISFEEHLQYKYMLVLDGNGAASSAQWVFGTGCVPIFVSHPDTHFWLKEFLVPMVTYVPVAYDLSDLHSKLHWLATNDEAAQSIAENALRLGQTLLSAEGQLGYVRRKMRASLCAKV